MRKLGVAVMTMVILVAAGCGGGKTSQQANKAEGTLPENVLTEINASFEDGSTGRWTLTGNCSIDNEATQAWSGTKSLKMTAIAAGDAQCGVIVEDVTSAGSQYTASFMFKGVVGKNYFVNIYGNVSGPTYSQAVIADGTWQEAACTKTFDEDDSQRLLYFLEQGAAAGDISYVDAVELKTSQGHKSRETPRRPSQ